jgi:hypothetical protein
MCLRRGGGRWAAPTRWWPAGGGPRPLLLFSFFVCRASQLRRTANDVARRLQGMLDAVLVGPPSVSFFCRAPGVAHDKDC